MSYMLNQINPAPHLLDPKETRLSAKRYALQWGIKTLKDEIAGLKRAIEHEEAILKGYGDALEERET